MPPPQSGQKPSQGQFSSGGIPPKRDIVFPSDSVEATTPILYRRKRLCRTDVGPTDAWRVFMSLRSGLLSESTWALDVLNVLLFDDSSVQYFGLTNLPGLLTLLLDHFQKSLSDMFEVIDVEHKEKRWTNGGIECSSTDNDDNNDDDDRRFHNNFNKNSNIGIENENTVDLGAVIDIPKLEDRLIVLQSTNNYTLNTRKGLPVKINQTESDIFVIDTVKAWDLDSNKNYQILTSVGNDPWTYGHTQPTPHKYIMDTFKAEIINIPFSKFIKKSTTKLKNGNRCDMDMDDDLIGNNNNHRTKSKTEINLIEINSIKNEKNEEEEILIEKDPLQMEDDDDDGNNDDNDNDVDPLLLISNNEKQQQQQQQQRSSVSDSDCRHIDMELERSSITTTGTTTTNGTTQKQSDSTTDNTVGGGGGIKKEIIETINIDNNKKHTTNKQINKHKFDIKSSINDPASKLKRRRMSDYEDECYTRDEASLYLVTETQDSLARRCLCISNILRNLTFIPGNETEFVKSSKFLSILGKLLLLYHEHPVRTQKTRNYDREEDADFSDSCSSLQGENEWYWDYLVQIRENMLVIAANISGHMELSRYDEFITRPILDGLLHWSVCPSAHGQDPFPTCSINTTLSPQRLALESLCKLCVTDANVDLVIATPPYLRLEKLCGVLTRHLCRNEDQVLREFSVNLLHYLAAADSAMSRTVAMQSPCISYLVGFIEQAEQTALGVANQHGINFLRENPDSMGTSLDMLRRAAGTLLHLSRHPDNRPLFMQQEQRLLGLVMSHILDQQVALIISRVLYQVSRGNGPLTTLSSSSTHHTSSTTSSNLLQSSSAVAGLLLSTNTTASVMSGAAVPVPLGHKNFLPNKSSTSKLTTINTLPNVASSTLVTTATAVPSEIITQTTSIQPPSPTTNCSLLKTIVGATSS